MAKTCDVKNAAAAAAPPTATDITKPSALSEYEAARARNIERNNARLRSLGLISIAEEKKSNDIAWGRDVTETTEDSSSDEEESSSDEEYNEGNNQSLKKKKRERKAQSNMPPREGSRKSRRLMNLPSEHTASDTIDVEDPAERRERIRQERLAMVEARQASSVQLAVAGLSPSPSQSPREIMV